MRSDNLAGATILRRVWRLLQWAICIGALLVAAVTPLGSDRLDAPGAPLLELWISVGVFALIAVCLSPPIFFRLSRFGKIGSYVGLLGAFITMVSFHDQALKAYYRTPEGAKVAASKAAQTKAEADRQQQEARKMAVVEEYNGIVDKLNACVNWKGEVPALSEEIKRSMHNPASFEHVSTKFVNLFAQKRNAVIEFRGTNGFGGIVKSQALAWVDPETCSVLALSNPE